MTKLRKHVRIHDVLKALLIMFIVVGFFILIDAAVERAQRLSLVVQPTSNWFEYDSVVPTKRAYARGETPAFISMATYHREIDMEWLDTMFCENLATGESKKVATQEWREVMSPESLTGLPWAWLEGLPGYPARCYLSGRPYGFVDGVRKNGERYTTETFLINQ